MAGQKEGEGETDIAASAMWEVMGAWRVGSAVVKAAAMLEMLAAPACSKGGKVCSQLFLLWWPVGVNFEVQSGGGVMQETADFWEARVPCPAGVGGASWAKLPITVRGTLYQRQQP